MTTTTTTTLHIHPQSGAEAFTLIYRPKSRQRLFRHATNTLGPSYNPLPLPFSGAVSSRLSGKSTEVGMSAKITVNFPHCLKFITLSDFHGTVERIYTYKRVGGSYGGGAWPFVSQLWLLSLTRCCLISVASNFLIIRRSCRNLANKKIFRLASARQLDGPQ